MTWTAENIAIEGKGARSVGNKLDRSKLPRRYWPCVDTELRQEKPVGHVLAGEAKA